MHWREAQVWHVVRVPTVAEEDARHLPCPERESPQWPAAGIAISLIACDSTQRVSFHGEWNYELLPR